MITKRKNKTVEPAALLRRMERLAGGKAKRKVREAQDLVYDSWEAAEGDVAFKLLARAVELDPTNVDAWLGLMRYEPLEGEEEIAFLRSLVALGEKNIGKKMPGSYSMGSPEEAVIAWEILKPAWKKHPEAHAWMIGKCGK